MQFRFEGGETLFASRAQLGAASDALLQAAELDEPGGEPSVVCVTDKTPHEMDAFLAVCLAPSDKDLAFPDITWARNNNALPA